MRTIEEQREFKEKLSLLEIVFPEIPKVDYILNEEQKINEKEVYYNGQKVNVNGFKELLIAGDKVINTTGNSVSTNLKIVVCVTYSLPYQGFVGYLI